MGENTRDSKEDRKARKAQAATARAAADPHANVTRYVTKRLADTTKRNVTLQASPPSRPATTATRKS